MRFQALVAIACLASFASSEAPFVRFSRTKGSFVVARGRNVDPIVVDENDWPGVRRVASDLRNDLRQVTGISPQLLNHPQKARRCIVIGTLGKSKIIDRLAASGRLKVSAIRGKWEATLTQVVKHPFPGVDEALVIAGSDKRGSIYGAYAISEQAGVSPWSWWADVPIKRHAELYVTPGAHLQNSPAVKYRGIFINDEAPSLSNWVYQNFGEYRHEFYIHVFELLLRLRANYLWPAMWNNCFSQDDPLNPKLADEYGIVMGTSHVEPMMRADKEWNRARFDPSWWNYDKHPVELEKFWTEGIQRNKPYENIVTIGMRGKVDTPMSETANISLLERIVSAQRKILAEYVNPDLTKVPQLWCLYKEVQDYYDRGMRVPDDVTLLWADDNWGNIRRLPTAGERVRHGGAGVYYHFDYVGGPRNYKWLNTTQIERVWEQMHLAHQAGANQIWIVNVGDIKPLEIPTEFFLRYAWNPERWDASNLREYTREWCEREFGPGHAASIADLIEKYTKYNARRKPELLDPSTYSLVNYNEADTVVEEYAALAARASAIEKMLPLNCRDAYYELVLHPILACANLNEMYVAAGKNRLYAAQGRLSANGYGARVKELFRHDAGLTTRFHQLKHGKWNHMMDQTHIGYTSWQQPDKQSMPEVRFVRASSKPGLGIAVEGSEAPDARTLPVLIPGKARWFEVFNTSVQPVPFTVVARQPWLNVLRSRRRAFGDERIYVIADSKQVPAGAVNGTVEVEGTDGSKFVITCPVRPAAARLHGLVEDDGYVSVDAEAYTAKVEGKGVYWKALPNLGRTAGSMTLFPTIARPQKLGPHLDYRAYFFTKGAVAINAFLSPTQLLWPGAGLRYGVSVDDEQPQVVNMHQGIVYFTPSWERTVANNINVRTTKHTIASPGWHTIRFWGIDPGVVLQKIVVDTGGLRPSYLGPPESRL